MLFFERGKLITNSAKVIYEIVILIFTSGTFIVQSKITLYCSAHCLIIHDQASFLTTGNSLLNMLVLNLIHVCEKVSWSQNLGTGCCSMTLRHECTIFSFGNRCLNMVRDTTNTFQANPGPHDWSIRMLECALWVDVTYVRKFNRPWLMYNCNYVHVFCENIILLRQWDKDLL